MMSSKTLRNFVKVHEQKLNAKISGLDASHLESQFSHEGRADRSQFSASAHWSMQESDQASRRRPKSRYFNFIMTPSQQ